MPSNIYISVICLTYNHRPYIDMCLKSIIGQNFSQKIEIIIHDDGSTDGTRLILQNFKEQYPEKVRLILNDRSKKLKTANFSRILKSIKPNGKYIAYCEGDDYWTDKNKLQIQYNFLESHPSFSFCCHRYEKLVDNNLEREIAHTFYKNKNLLITKTLFFQTWATQPLTTMLRGKYWNDVIKESSKYPHFRDVHLFYAYLEKGKGISLNNFMGIYRIHDKGMKSGKSTIENLNIAYKIWKELLIFNPTDKELCNQYLSVVRKIMLYSSTNKRVKLYKNNFKLSSKNFINFIKLHLYLLKYSPPPKN